MRVRRAGLLHACLPARLQAALLDLSEVWTASISEGRAGRGAVRNEGARSGTASAQRANRRALVEQAYAGPGRRAVACGTVEGVWGIHAPV